MDFQQGQALLLLVDKKPFAGERDELLRSTKEMYPVSATAGFAVPKKARTKGSNF